jgi:uncharacterized protein YdaU (DUF1376 family)
MQLWVGDFIASTNHLSLDQKGGYLLLMFAMWNAGGWLPNDPVKLARICGISLKRWQHIAPEVLEFFDQDGDRLTQKRLAAEYQKQSEIIEKRSAAGKLGNSVKSLKSNNTVPASAVAKTEQGDRMSSPSPESSSESEEKKGKEVDSLPMHLPAVRPAKRRREGKSVSAAAIEPDFREFMLCYPRPVDEDAARRAYRAVRRDGRGTAAEILSGARRYAASMRGVEPRFIKAPQNWLSAGSWKNPDIETSNNTLIQHGASHDATIAGFNRRPTS